MEKGTKRFVLGLSKYNQLLQLIIGILTALAGLASIFTKILESKFNIAFVSIGLFFITRVICNFVITAKRKSFDIVTSKYSTREIRIAKYSKVAAYAFLAFPLFVITAYLTPKKDKCEEANASLGLLITNFTNSPGDDFSYKLYDLLDMELQEVDTIKTIRINKFVDTQNPNYIDSIKTSFRQNCFNRGLLVFGKRSIDTKLFDCNLYVGSLIGASERSIKVNSKNVIYLQNPDLINFSIDYQAKTISDFILGLLYYNSNNFTLSTEKFKSALERDANHDDIKFKSYCYLFVGNNSYRQGESQVAIKEYKRGISCDSNNSFLHYNLAIAILKTGDSVKAYNEYYISKRLNPNMSNASMQNLYIVKSTPEAHVESVRTAYRKNRSDDPQVNVDILTKKNTISKEQEVTNFSVVIDGTKFGVVNRNRDTIIKCKYDFIDSNIFVCQGKRYFIVKIGQKYGALNQIGNVEIPINHPSIEYVQFVIKATNNMDTTGISTQF